MNWSGSTPPRSLLLLLLTACGQTGDPPLNQPLEPPRAAATKEFSMPTATPFGSWPSPISAASLVEDSRGISDVQEDGEFVYWLESRPQQGGRITIMRWSEDQDAEELLAEEYNVRTRVHEYGGNDLLVRDGVLWFINFIDQRLYRFQPGARPRAITAETADASLRFAACAADPLRQRLICVREDHRGGGEASNALVAVPMDGESEPGTVLFADSDFVSAATLSADGRHLAFVSWDHPNMPWDDTKLWSAEFADDGQLRGLRHHNPGIAEAVMDPQWGPDNTLYVISDRDNWWQLYRVRNEAFQALLDASDDTEVGGPMWMVGSHFVNILSDGSMLVKRNQGGLGSLAIIDPAKGSATTLALGCTAIGSVATVGNAINLVCYFSDRPAALLRTNLSGALQQTIRLSTELAPDPALVPEYRMLSFPTAGGRATAHGIYLPPTNPAVIAPDGPPPLIITVHGGPTDVATPVLQKRQLFWTSRGFAILDLNYRGSTGFGREYRRALYGKWGVADVEDAVAGASWLAEQGLADPARLIIRGGSAGGYTTLAALAFHDIFSAGASHYGISDLEALAQETHKFESRYTDQIVGPYPERKDLYVARSPIHHLQGFTAPLILLQGLDDRVVPPNQSELIYQALKQRGVPTAYLAVAGEGHGFRKAENVIRAMEAELYFYSRVLGFELAEELPPIDIDNLGTVADPD